MGWAEKVPVRLPWHPQSFRACAPAAHSTEGAGGLSTDGQERGRTFNPSAAAGGPWQHSAQLDAEEEGGAMVRSGHCPGTCESRFEFPALSLLPWACGTAAVHQKPSLAGALRARPGAVQSIWPRLSPPPKLPFLHPPPCPPPPVGLEPIPLFLSCSCARPSWEFSLLPLSGFAQPGHGLTPL